MKIDFLFFDNASTTRCCDEAAELVRLFGDIEFGNPSSGHAMGKRAAQAISQARQFFAQTFNTSPAQILFTGSGTEADNLAVYGVALDALANRSKSGSGPVPRVLASSIEHPAVRKTVQSLISLGIDAQLIPVDGYGQINLQEFTKLLTPATVLVSIHQVNNIVGSVLPVEELATLAKKLVPGVIFHSDCVQAFGRVDLPRAPSAVDMLSISAHKVEGPKGVGALVVLNPELLKSGLRPLIWGGDQEGGFRSGTQSAGLIGGFHVASVQTLAKRGESRAQVGRLRAHFEELLVKYGLCGKNESPFKINSPRDHAVPHIVNLSAPGYPAGMIAQFLEEQGCLISTGSACSSHKSEPDAVLTAMGLPRQITNSALRISFASNNSIADIETLSKALVEAVQRVSALLGGAPQAT